MSDDKKKPNLVVLVGDHQSVGSVIAKHLAAEGNMTQLVEPLKFGYSEDYGLPVNQFLSAWTKELGRVHRPKAGYRYRGVKNAVAANKERKHRVVPRFLQRQRGEEIFTLPFHCDEWGDVYFPRSSKLIDF